MFSTAPAIMIGQIIHPLDKCNTQLTASAIIHANITFPWHFSQMRVHGDVPDVSVKGNEQLSLTSFRILYPSTRWVSAGLAIGREAAQYKMMGFQDVEFVKGICSI